ncbi:MAG: LysM repeat protein [Glaciecola sp.]|jgi:LysM repeat protein
MKYIFSVIVLLASLICQGQLQDSTVIFNGKEYSLHKMEQGETLYQLSRKYKVSFSSVREGNPDKGDEVGLGDLIRIPSSYIAPKKEDSDSTDTQPVVGQSITPVAAEKVEALPLGYYWYEIQQGETIYSLHVKFKTTEEQLLNDNPLVKSVGLKTGQKIKLRKDTFDSESKKNSVLEAIKSLRSNIDSATLTDTNVFRIGLLLPFNLEENKSRMENVREGQEVEIMNQTKFFLEFLQGAKFAIDSLKNKGQNIQVFVFDTKSDTNHIASLLKKGEFKKLNMIVGPAFGHNFEYLAKRMNGSNTFLVSPYGKKMSILSRNPKVIKCRPSVNSRIKPLAEFLYYNHKNDNIIFSHEGSVDLLLVEKLQTEILALSLLQDSVIMPSPVIVKGVFEPVAKLNNQRKNIVVSMNIKESFATKLVVKMQSKHKDFEIVLIGMEEWKSYKNIEVRYWESLSMHVVGNLDYRYLGVKSESFFTSYFKVHYTEPSYHAVLAYEILLNLCGKLENNIYSHTQVAGRHTKGEVSNYLYKFTGNRTGLDNVSTTVYKYKDFKFVPVIDEQ